LINLATQFAAQSSSSGGISSLGIDLKEFIFQLISFVISLLILRRWVFPKLVATLEARRKTLEESLVQARETEEALRNAEEKAGDVIQKARGEADAALAEAQKKAEEIIAAGETAAGERAARIIKEAEAHLSQERERLHDQLRGELVDLVAQTTEKVLRSKLNERDDRALIEKSIKELA
jgi:F-type H+-transporting ATPase subunit b